MCLGDPRRRRRGRQPGDESLSEAFSKVLFAALADTLKFGRHCRGRRKGVAHLAEVAIPRRIMAMGGREIEVAVGPGKSIYRARVYTSPGTSDCARVRHTRPPTWQACTRLRLRSHHCSLRVAISPDISVPDRAYTRPGRYTTRLPATFRCTKISRRAYRRTCPTYRRDYNTYSVEMRMRKERKIGRRNGAVGEHVIV